MKMKELFDRGEFVVSAEVGPPKGIHVDELVEEAKTYLKDVQEKILCQWHRNFEERLQEKY